MGCYGIGLGRLMGTIVEVHHDSRGIIWPASVAPFSVHLILLGEESKLVKKAQELYNKLIQEGIEVLYDDRQESAGIKLNDADLLGLPLRIVLSEKTYKEDCIEVKKRDSEKVEFVNYAKLNKYLTVAL